MGFIHHVVICLTVVCGLLYLGVPLTPSLWMFTFVCFFSLGVDYGFLQKKNYWGAVGFVLSVFALSALAIHVFITVFLSLLVRTTYF